MPLSWFTSYLFDCTKFLQLENIHSQSFSVTSSVSQGSVPIQFIVFYPSGEELEGYHLAVSFESHVKQLTSICIARLCLSLTPQRTEILIHALITSCIDYCNYNLFPNKLLHKLQLIQKTTWYKLIQHVTPSFQQLHQLLIKLYIDFKILLKDASHFQNHLTSQISYNSVSPLLLLGPLHWDLSLQHVPSSRSLAPKIVIKLLPFSGTLYQKTSATFYPIITLCRKFYLLFFYVHCFLLLFFAY